MASKICASKEHRRERGDARREGVDALEVKSRESWNPAFYTRTRRASMSELADLSIASDTRTVIPRCACRQELLPPLRVRGILPPLREGSVVDELRRREVVDAKKRDTISIGSSTIM